MHQYHDLKGQATKNEAPAPSEEEGSTDSGRTTIRRHADSEHRGRSEQSKHGKLLQSVTQAVVTKTKWLDPRSRQGRRVCELDVGWLRQGKNQRPTRLVIISPAVGMYYATVAVK